MVEAGEEGEDSSQKRRRRGGGGGGGGEDSFTEEVSPEQGFEGRIGVGCVHMPACVFEYRVCILAFCLASWDAIRLD